MVFRQKLSNKRALQLRRARIERYSEDTSDTYFNDKKTRQTDEPCSRIETLSEPVDCTQLRCALYKIEMYCAGHGRSLRTLYKRGRHNMLLRCGSWVGLYSIMKRSSTRTVSLLQRGFSGCWPLSLSSC